MNETIKTYNNAATQLAEYFDSIGPRTSDIESALTLRRRANEPITAVELGCGNGRDAKEIISKVDEYIGVDPSTGMLDIARQNNPHATFVQSTAQDYEFTVKPDVVFAFASFLHIPPNELAQVFDKIAAVQQPGDIVYVSMKWAEKHTSVTRHDSFGYRQFYYYNEQILSACAGPRYAIPHIGRQTINSVNEWITMGFRRV